LKERVKDLENKLKEKKRDGEGRRKG